MRKAKLRRSDLGQHLLTASGSFKSVRPLAMSLGLVILILMLFYGINDQNWDRIRSALPIIALTWLAGVVILWLSVSFMRVRVFSLGIEGRSIGGFRRRILWKDLAGVRVDNSSGFAALVFREEDTGREMWMLREIMERSDFRRATSPYIDWEALLAKD